MNCASLFPLAAVLFVAAAAHAQLAVTVSPPKTAGSKTVVKLEMKNAFTNGIESARAVCFLVDEHGKVLGHSTKWVVGSSAAKSSLAPGATIFFNFVFTADTPYNTTNLTAKVTFNRVILDGGKLADPTKVVQ